MARHEHLPIYKAALDLAADLQKVVADFSRYHRVTLGTELRQGSRAVLQQVVRANNATAAAERAAELLCLREHIDALLLTMRVGKEVQALAVMSHRCAMRVCAEALRAFRSFSGYLHAVEQVGVVARQNEGWFKHTRALA